MLNLATDAKLVKGLCMNGAQLAYQGTPLTSSWLSLNWLQTRRAALNISAVCIQGLGARLINLSSYGAISSVLLDKGVKKGRDYLLLVDLSPLTRI